MMFLEFFIWGGWFVTMGTFLSQNFSASGSQLAQAYETQSIGAIVAPFIIGLVADRYFSAQKILGFLHIIGAFLLFQAGVQNDFVSFYPFIFIYMILYMPTLALVNSVAFRQMVDPSKEFPPIRVFGTVGWIVAGLTIGFLGWESQKILEKLKVRRDATVKGLNAIDGIDIVAPRTTFYLFPNVTKVMERKGLHKIEDLQNGALTNANISFCTREHFGRAQADESDYYIRLAYSGISVEDINEGLIKLKDFFESQ